MRQFFHNNSLSIVMLSLFAFSLVGQTTTGLRVFNEEQTSHGLERVDTFHYVRTGHFVEAVFENWESEFLQMGMYVLLTVFLFQKGSPDTNDPDEPKEMDAGSIGHVDVPWPVRRGGWALRIYAHSLSLSLFLLFLVSFVLHGAGGAKAASADSLAHGGEAVTFLAYFGTSRFWFESLQNWQSEFLSVPVLVILSIFLRERGSAESKPVDEPHLESRPSH